MLRDLARHRVPVRTFWPQPVHAERWAEVAPDRAVVVDRRAHLLDLEPGWDALWSKGFTAQRRRGVRTAERRGVKVESGTAGELLPEFYGLLELATARWARMQHEPRWLTMARLRGRDPLKKFQAAAAPSARGSGCRSPRWTGGRWRGWSCSRVATPTTSAARWTRPCATTAPTTSCTPGPSRTPAVRVRRLLHGRLRLVPSAAAFKERFGARPLHCREYRFERLPLSRTEKAVKTRREEGHRVPGLLSA